MFSISAIYVEFSIYCTQELRVNDTFGVTMVLNILN